MNRRVIRCSAGPLGVVASPSHSAPRRGISRGPRRRASGARHGRPLEPLAGTRRVSQLPGPAPVPTRARPARSPLPRGPFSREKPRRHAALARPRPGAPPRARPRARASTEARAAPRAPDRRTRADATNPPRRPRAAEVSNPRRRAPRDAADPRSIPHDQPARAPARPNARDISTFAKYEPPAANDHIIDSPPSPFASALAQHPDRPLVCAPCSTRTLRPRRVALASLERRHASARAALDAALDAETGGGDAVMTAARLRVAAAKTRLDASRVRAAAFARTARLEREALDAIGARLAARERALDAARSALAQSARRALETEWPERIRRAALTLRAARDEKARGVKFAIARLGDMLPLSLEEEEEDLEGDYLEGPGFESRRSDGIPPRRVTVGRLFRVPDAGAAGRFDADELGAALGVLFAFCERFAAILEAPLVHGSAATRAEEVGGRVSGPPSGGKIVGPGDFEAPPPISNTEAALFAPRDFWTHRAASAADTKIGVEVYYTPGDDRATFDDGAAFFSGAAFDGASDGDILVRDRGRSQPSGRGRPSADRVGYAQDTLKALGALARKAAEGGSAALTSRGGVPGGGGGDASRSLDASEEAATRRRALRAAVALAHRSCAALRDAATRELGVDDSISRGYGPVAALARVAAECARDAPPTRRERLTTARRSAGRGSRYPGEGDAREDTSTVTFDRNRNRDRDRDRNRDRDRTGGGASASSAPSVGGWVQVLPLPDAARRVGARYARRVAEEVGAGGSVRAAALGALGALRSAGEGAAARVSAGGRMLAEAAAARGKGHSYIYEARAGGGGGGGGMVLRRDGSGAANRRPTIGSADGDDDGSEWDLADVPVEASETSEDFGETSERLRNAGTGTGDAGTGTGSGARRGSGGERVESLRERHARRARAGLEGAAAVLPPPPSAPEDVEHWTRAMYVDARR